MKHRHTQVLPHGSGLKWRYRRQESTSTGAPQEHDSIEDARELFAASRPVTRLVDLSPAARLLYGALCCHDDYVICIDILTLADRMEMSEHKIHCCLNELHRAGMISMWIGNLVFFD